jgi:hypothetical protein
MVWFYLPSQHHANSCVRTANRDLRKNPLKFPPARIAEVFYSCTSAFLLWCQLGIVLALEGVEPLFKGEQSVPTNPGSNPPVEPSHSRGSPVVQSDPPA